MAAWIAIIVPVVMSLFVAVFAVGLMRQGINGVIAGQAELLTQMSAVKMAIGTLTTHSEVTKSKYDELSRRISDVEHTLGIHDERINVLRTKHHMIAGKLMEIDPKWRPYMDGGGD